MNLASLTRNGIIGTEKQLKDEKELERAYTAILSGSAIRPEQADVLDSYISSYKKLENAKAKNLGLESLMPNKTAEKKLEKKEASFMPFQKKEPVGVYDKMMLASLLKDTPEGEYQNTMARMEAQDNLNSGKYMNAFQSLQERADQNIPIILKDQELGHPDIIKVTEENFGLLKEFAPSLAANPVTAKSFLKKLNAYGGIDEKTVGELIRTNNAYMEHRMNMRR